MDNDLEMVKNSDLVVAFVENKRQIGTLYEIAYAIEHNISVIVVCEQPSPFFVTLVDWYPTLEALKKKGTIQVFEDEWNFYEEEI